MAEIVRRKLARLLVNANCFGESSIGSSAGDRLATLIRCTEVNKSAKTDRGQFVLKLDECNRKLQSKLNVDHIANAMRPNDWLEGVDVVKDKVLFRLNRKAFVKGVLEHISEHSATFGFNSHLNRTTYCDEQRSWKEIGTLKVLVEFSSPNIAKPFHYGHLRSTILGSFVSNLYQRLGHQVTRVNYLGDWGTQIGLLVVGFDKYGDARSLEENPLTHLMQVYVKANQDEALREEALKFFSALEKGDARCAQQWRTLREISLRELSAMYQRLNITFDEYHFESDFVPRNSLLRGLLDEKGLLKRREDGTLCVSLPEEKMEFTFLKSDGSSLYIARDLEALLWRKSHYDFDRIHYVVDQSQSDHFRQLVATARAVGLTLPTRQVLIPFGRVKGMQTRTGRVQLLADILDEAERIALANMRGMKVRHHHQDEAAVTRILARSMLIVHDFREQPIRERDFRWEHIMQMAGADSGFSLQYCHARLCNLERKCGVQWNEHASVELLGGDAEHQLVQLLARFDEAVHQSFSSLSPHPIVNYLIKLSHQVNSCLHSLYVKGEEKDVAQARLHLFRCARLVLSNGLNVIGLEPLEDL